MVQDTVGEAGLGRVICPVCCGNRKIRAWLVTHNKGSYVTPGKIRERKRYTCGICCGTGLVDPATPSRFGFGVFKL
jgi:hypothetical protein